MTGSPWSRTPVLVAIVTGVTVAIVAVISLVWHVTDQDHQLREQIVDLCGDEAIEVREDCIDTWHGEFFE